MSNTTLNQSKEVFIQWLGQQPDDAIGIAGDPCSCWLAQWFESQIGYVWGVFPQHYLERCSDAPGGASQEVLLAEPEQDEDGEWIVNSSDRISLEQWACEFATELDYLYCKPFRNSAVTKDQALELSRSDRHD